MQSRFAKVKFCMHGLNAVFYILPPHKKICSGLAVITFLCFYLVLSLLPYLCESPALFFLLFLSCNSSSSAHSPVLRTEGSLHGVGTQTMSWAPTVLLQALERSRGSMSSSLCVRLCVDVVIVCSSALVWLSFIAMERYGKIRVMAQNPHIHGNSSET